MSLHKPIIAAGALLLALTVTNPTVALASSLLSDGGPGAMKIDLLPGNPQNSVDLGRQRLLPIAIYGSDSLDVNDLNPRTLSLEAETQNLVGKSDKSLCRQEDLDNDGRMDLVCNLKTIGYRVEPGEIPVVISAGTYQRRSLRATTVLRYVIE